VLIEEKPHRAFIGVVIGNEQVGAIPDKDALRIEGVMLFEDARDSLVESLMQ